jgi:hypothetical protein
LIIGSNSSVFQELQNGSTLRFQGFQRRKQFFQHLLGYVNVHVTLLGNFSALDARTAMGCGPDQTLRA